MRINPVNLNQALSRTQSAGVGAVPRVIEKPASGQLADVNAAELEFAPTSSNGITKTYKKNRKRGRKNILDQLGSTVDVWA